MQFMEQNKQLKLGLRSDYGVYSFGAVLPQTIKFWGKFSYSASCLMC